MWRVRKWQRQKSKSEASNARLARAPILPGCPPPPRLRLRGDGGSASRAGRFSRMCWHQTGLVRARMSVKAGEV